MKKLNVVWYWQTMGPYHFARMEAFARMPNVDLFVVECASVDDHGWARANQSNFELHTLAAEQLSRDVLRKTRQSFSDILKTRKPDIVIAPGYAHPQCLGPILTYRKSNRSAFAILWSESTVMDACRLRWKEGFKTLVMSLFDGALVAGNLHAEYLKQLRMPNHDIQIVGNCVDNDYFSKKSKALRAENGVDPQVRSSDFFLYVGRLIPVKNLPALIKAYNAYRELSRTTPWDLVLVGGGSEESALRELVHGSNICGVRFAGVQQMDQLPYYYSSAKCFVLPSLSEPWGLVVNEAMASGLPILASNRCGCVRDLVREGVNGYLFDPDDERALTQLLMKISSGDVPLQEFGANSEKIISDYTPALFAQRASEHLALLHQRRTQRRSIRRVIAENAYAMFGASLELSDLTVPVRNLWNRTVG